MTRPYSNDLRERAVCAVQAGGSCRAVAARFGVAVSSVVKWSQRYRETGSVAPGQMGGHRKRILEPHGDFIKERISQTQHLTLHGLKDELAARGVAVSHNAIWQFLRREGLSFKKKHCSQLSKTGRTLRGAGRAGRHYRTGSTRPGWCLSMRPGSRPTWLRFAAGDRRASDCAALPLTVTGGQ